MKHKGSSLDSTIVIGVHYRGLYRMITRPMRALVHETISLSGVWHIWFSHLHYIALPSLGKIVTSCLEIKVEHDKVCQCCTLRKFSKRTFLRSKTRSKGILDLVHLYLCGPLTITFLGVYLYYALFIDDFS